MSASPIITLVLAVAAHLGYYGFITSADRAWCAYVCTGLLLAWIGWRDRQQASSGLALFGATYILIESAQVAVCGSLAWGMKTAPGDDLCVAVGGGTLYAALASLALAAGWTWRRSLWPSQQQSPK